MRRYFLTLFIVLTLGVSACYRDNWEVNSVEISDKYYNFSVMYRGIEKSISIQSEFANNNFSAECINQLTIDKKLPECMREQTLLIMGIKK